MKKLLKTIACIGFAAFMLWSVWSFMDITNNNKFPEPQYSEYNLFINK